MMYTQGLEKRKTRKTEVHVESGSFQISDSVLLGVRTESLSLQIVISKDDKQISAWVPTVTDCNSCFENCFGKESEKKDAMNDQ